MKKNRLILTLLCCVFSFFQLVAQSSNAASSFEQKIEQYINSDNHLVKRKGLEAKLGIVKDPVRKAEIEKQLKELRSINNTKVSLGEDGVASFVSTENNLSVNHLDQSKNIQSYNDDHIWENMIRALRSESANNKKDLSISDDLRAKAGEMNENFRSNSQPFRAIIKDVRGKKYIQIVDLPQQFGMQPTSASN